MTVDQGSVLTDNGRKEDNVIIVPGGFQSVQSPPVSGQIRAAAVLAQQVAKKKKSKKAKGSDDDEDDSESDSDSDRDEDEDDREEEIVETKPSKKSQKKKASKAKKQKAAFSGDVSAMRDEVGNLDWSDEEA
jgi:hypothetical protein